ncbi:MAG: HAD-IC family P-type ATPase [Methanomassiliicoccaceae archaeon]|jgi:cation-transporting ATPase E|nr:HAD-IC family P-type ATPase [Methanomassiliicoccaceae archaeon]
MDINGLTASEVEERILRKEVNSAEIAVSRSYLDIITKNVFTFFNLIIFSIGAMLYLLDELTSALAATGIIVLNIFIATIQEMRAKRRLDKIALLMRPKVAVIRDGEQTTIDQSEIVRDDIIHFRGGDQALVDGILVSVKALEVDESLLTGESRTIRKKVDDTVFSGSFCITGEGYYRVTALGEETFAANMLASAKKFDNKLTPLQMETSAITKLMMVVALVYLLTMIIVKIINGNGLSSLLTADFEGLVGDVKMAAVILDMVPIALFLMIVIAYMVAAVRLSNSGILLQRSNAIESISHVNTVCMDKTGTITTNKLVFKDIHPFTDPETAENYIRIFVSATGSRNRTVDALANKFGTTSTELIEEIMFSSERKYSAVRVLDNDKELSLVVGAYDSLASKIKDPGDIKELISGYSEFGLRSIVIAKAGKGGLHDKDEPVIRPLELVALIALEDEVRPDCKKTMDSFIASGIDIRILSGDDPAAVNALFTIAGLPGERKILSGIELETLEGEERRKRILETNIFGRMKPDQKELVIEELKESGRYVAMVGDGVNDVKSLKEANVGIALQSGSGAARGVADMILVSDDFSSLPRALIEGNRTVSGMRDILKMYLARNFVIAILVLLTAALFHTPPLLPITNAVYAFLGLSIASFLMIIWAKPSKVEESVLPSVLKHAIPTALLISLFGFLLYCLFTLDGVHDILGITLTDAQRSIYGWNAGAGVIGEATEIVARNALLVFLLSAALLQILFVAPYFREFSVDGRLHKDIKPTIMVFVLLALVVLVFWAINEYGDTYTFVKEFSIFILPPSVYIITIGFIAAWFFVTRWALREKFLDRFSHFTEWLYSMQLNRMHKKFEKRKKYEREHQ